MDTLSRLKRIANMKSDLDGDKQLMFDAIAEIQRLNKRIEVLDRMLRAQANNIAAYRRKIAPANRG
jgi:hypothetical protein